MTTTTISPFSTATEMLRALRVREASAVELLDLHLARIERYNPALNAIVIPTVALAREAAEAADAARARGGDGALLGLPMTLKESFDLAGERSTAGVEEFAAYRAEADGPLAASVRAAGGVILGKTNVPPMLADWQSDNPIFGRSNNPWDLERTPGGSTGGGAAAVAAGLSALEYGSDIGGSIRVPAAFCGIYGHRPSQTAIPGNGSFPGGLALPNPARLLAVAGPLARSAEDLRLAFDVVAGPVVGEDVAWRLQIPPARFERLADARIAVLPPIPWLPLDAEIAAAQERVIDALRSAGARVEVAQPERFGDLREHHKLYLRLLTVMTAARQREEREATAAALRQGDEFGVAQAEGMVASAADYLTWVYQREQYRAAYRDFFREWDLLLSPAFGVPAFPHMPQPFHERFHTVDGQRVDYGHQLGYPSVAILSGQPATAFPAGHTRERLPIGLQAVGPYLEDHTPLRFAALLAEEIGGFTPPPGYE